MLILLLCFALVACGRLHLRQFLGITSNNGLESADRNGRSAGGGQASTELRPFSVKAVLYGSFVVLLFCFVVGLFGKHTFKHLKLMK